MIVKSINNLTLDNYEFSNGHGYLHSNFLQISERPQDITMRRLSNTTFELAINNFILNFWSRQFKYAMVFIPIKGHCKVTMRGAQLIVQLTLAEQPSLKKAGRSVPVFTVNYANLVINRRYLDFDLGGGFLAGFVDFFMPLFERKISKDLEAAVEYHIKRDVPVLMNEMFLTDDGYFFPSQNPLYKNMALDYAFETRPAVVDDFLGFGFNGTMVNIDKKEYIPQTLPFAMPFRNKDVNSRLQIFFSEYFLESFSHTFFENSPLIMHVASKDVPEIFPFKLTTAALDPYFKGLKESFGGDYPVDATFQLVTLNKFQILRSKQKIRAIANLNMKFTVNKDG